MPNKLRKSKTPKRSSRSSRSSKTSRSSRSSRSSKTSRSSKPSRSSKTSRSSRSSKTSKAQRGGGLKFWKKNPNDIPKEAQDIINNSDFIMKDSMHNIAALAAFRLIDKGDKKVVKEMQDVLDELIREDMINLDTKPDDNTPSPIAQHGKGTISKDIKYIEIYKQ